MNRKFQWLLAAICLAGLAVVTLNAFKGGESPSISPEDLDTQATTNTNQAEESPVSSSVVLKQTLGGDDITALVEAKETFILAAETTYCSYCKIYDEDVLVDYEVEAMGATLYQTYLDTDFEGGVEEALVFFTELGVNLTSTPTTIFVKDGVVVSTTEGVMDLTALQANIETHLAKTE